MNDYQRGLNDAIDFVLHHHEFYQTGLKEFTLTPVPKYLPESQQYFEARVTRWKELAAEHFNQK